ncbi:MAG TPA: nucleotidyltransferase family protein [Anaeromyxobacteraceae bacterium]|nr:nucleotidyltransferase family protein [Anaeromyxobacteraceae bacterium]
MLAPAWPAALSALAAGLAVRCLATYNAPMRRAEVLRIIALHEAELRGLGVRALSIFGSVARDEASPASDLDVLVEFDGPVGFFHLYEVQERLESLLGCKVDIVTPGGLRPELKQAILTEAVRAA